MKRVVSLGSIVFEYNSLFVQEEFSPKNKIVETYLSAANTRITYSADLQNPPITLDSKQYSYVTDDQRIAIIEAYNNDSELVAQFTDGTMEILKFTLESPPTFQELYEGACLYTAIIPMYYVYPQGNDYFSLNVVTTTPEYNMELTVKYSSSGYVVIDTPDYMTFTNIEDDFSFFCENIGTHKIQFSNSIDIEKIVTTKVTGILTELPNNIEYVSITDGTITGYSGSQINSDVIYIDLSNNSIGVTALNSILTKLDAATSSDGTAIFTGNSIPTNATAIASLEARGWTVTVDV